MVFAVIGWLFKRFDYSVPAAVIGILLGNMAESNLIYSYQISGGQWSYLLERPMTIGIVVLLFVSLLGGKLVNMLTGKINSQADA